MAVKFIANQTYDASTTRQYLNNELTVLHCHHYSALFTQLANDAKLLKGVKAMVESAEEAFLPVLSKYYQDNNIESAADRASIAEQYFSFIGLGRININANKDGGTAEMTHSHVDEGWIKKWSKRDEPVNLIGQGFLAAAFAAINSSSAGTYAVTETQSIVSGAASSKFAITIK